jgi:hypothetical protein
MKKTLFVSFLMLGAAGCFNRSHMSDNYGRSYRQAFERQAANPNAGATAKSPQGLDALESSIVVENFRAQLATKGGSGDTSSQQMIVLSPNTGQVPLYTPSLGNSSNPK